MGRWGNPPYRYQTLHVDVKHRYTGDAGELKIVKYIYVTLFINGP